MLFAYFVLSGPEKIQNGQVFRVHLQGPLRSVIITWHCTYAPVPKSSTPFKLAGTVSIAS